MSNWLLSIIILSLHCTKFDNFGVYREITPVVCSVNWSKLVASNKLMAQAQDTTWMLHKLATYILKYVMISKNRHEILFIANHSTLGQGHTPAFNSTSISYTNLPAESQHLFLLL